MECDWFSDKYGEMDRTCSTHRGMRNAYNVEGRGHSEDLGVDGKTILEWILEK
jgi:hypothetical protein